MGNVLNIAICEDDQREFDYLLSCMNESQVEFAYKYFTDGEDFIKQYYPGEYDLIFMDIYMKESNGVDVVSKVRELDEQAIIAFITTSTDHFADGYRLHVNRYLVKPFSADDVKEVMVKAEKELALKPHIDVKCEGKMISLIECEISYVEQDGHYVYIHMVNNDQYKVLTKLDDFEKLLTLDSFYRCHQSYLVNLAHVISFDKDNRLFVMKGGHDVYIRRPSIFEAKKALQAYLFRKSRL